MAISELTTEQEFDDFVKSNEQLSVVYFYADWAECSQMDDVLEEMSKLEQYKDIKFAKIHAENVPEVSMKSKVSGVPTTLLLRNSKVIDRIDGAHPSKLTEKVKHHLNNEDTLFDTAKAKESLEDRLKKLVNQAPCMLFMKGTPTNPRCGFSRSMISILDGYNVDYETFDILQDNEVREGLKSFSNWPTYPQLYVNGELVGGIDVVKELDKLGELESMLKKKSVDTN